MASAALALDRRDVDGCGSHCSRPTLGESAINLFAWLAATLFWGGVFA